MREVIVRTQQELDAAIYGFLGRYSGRITVDSPEDVEITVTRSTDVLFVITGCSWISRVDGDARIDRVEGHARIGRVTGMARIDVVTDQARIDVVTGEAAINEVSGSAQIDRVTGVARIGRVDNHARIGRVDDHARIAWTSGFARVREVAEQAQIAQIDDQARIIWMATTSAIHVYDAATISVMSDQTVIYLHSRLATLGYGGHIIDVTSFDKTDPGAWCARAAVRVDADTARLYTAVDQDYTAGQIRYPIGETVIRPNPTDGHDHGLYLAPTPGLAQAHATLPPDTDIRLLEVECYLADIRPIDADKCTVPVLRVLREVTIDGDPIDAGEVAW